MAQVLIIDDDPDLLAVCRVGLQALGHVVHTAETGSDGLAETAVSRPDVIVLDLGLPDLDGVEVCKRIRAWSRTPIIVLSADSTEDRKVEALDAGADDYVTKPFRMRELVARIHAVSRRSPHQQMHDDERVERTDDGQISSGEVTVDAVQRRVFVRDAEVRLRRKEFDLLCLLVENAGRVLTRDVLIDRVWGSDYIGDTKTLDVHIKRLRSQIELDPGQPTLITTVRGVGYRFADPKR